MLKVKDIHEGAEVYWNDPDGDFSSGYYFVTKILADLNDPDFEDDGEVIVCLKNNAGSEVEVFNHELS